MFNRYQGNTGKFQRVPDQVPVAQSRRTYTPSTEHEVQQPNPVDEKVQHIEKEASASVQEPEKKPPMQSENGPPSSKQPQNNQNRHASERNNQHRQSSAQSAPQNRRTHQNRPNRKTQEPPEKPAEEKTKTEEKSSPLNFKNIMEGGLGGLLDKFNISKLETEDIILLLMLYLLYRDSGDSEFLIIMAVMLFL